MNLRSMRTAQCGLAVLMTALMSVASGSETLPDGVRLLQEQNAQFERQVMEVAPGVYVGVGYAGSNASMIVGDDGVIIIDTLPALASAQLLADEFRRISAKPVKAIIYTHGHIDHVGGARQFAGGGEPEVIARANFEVERVDANRQNPIMARRSAWQFGRALAPHTERINLGVGPAVQPMDGFGQGELTPTRFMVGESETLLLAGVSVELVAAPGETDDQLFVWLPHHKVLFSGDNFYRSFPNLYAIRGTRYRDVLQWADSLDHMSRYPATVLVPGHTRPVSGAEDVHQALTDYRDAIRFVHDETLAGMNRGLSPDELVFEVRLPEHLAQRDYLREYYGRVDAAVRAIFSGYVGWFDGNPTHLSNLSPAEEAQQVASLAGGEAALMERLRDAQNEGNHRWSLRLADYLLLLREYRPQATDAKVAALRALADQTMNAPTRNYYLSAAHALEQTSAD